MTEVEEQTEFKFSELSNSAKDKARDAARYNDVQDEWWDNTYGDVVRMSALLGVNISSTQHISTKGRNYSTIDISFSGFSSQGDGASFEGNYWYVPDAVAKITAETNDKELIRIAQELTLLQMTRRLLGYDPFGATITTSGRYLHSGTMDIILNYDVDENDEPSYDDGLENNVIQLMRRFADWIYKQLEAEHDYLTSDEYIDERLNEDETLFDEDGEEII